MMKKMSHIIKEESSFKKNHHYLSLCPQDALYRHNLSLLKHRPQQIIIHTILKDFNYLLHLNQYQFQKEIEQNATLQTTLQSFLSVLPRKCYDHYQGNHPVQLDQIFKLDDSFKKYSILLKTFLLIYYRISSETPLSMMNIMSIPYLLDFAAIYGPNNPAIVAQVITNTYSFCYYSHRDTFLFFDALYEHEILTFQGDKSMIQIDFSEESLKKKHFFSRQKFLLQMLTKEIFKIKDFMFNLTNFIKYFPKVYTSYLASDYAFQDTLLQKLLHFLKGFQKWKLEKYSSIFQPHFHDIRQTISDYFVLIFKSLKNILLQDSNEDQSIKYEAEVTYERLFLDLDVNTNDQNSFEKNILRFLIEKSLEQRLTIFPSRPLQRKKEELSFLVDENDQTFESRMIFENQPHQEQIKWRALNVIKYSCENLEYQDELDDEELEKTFFINYDHAESYNTDFNEHLMSYQHQKANLTKNNNQKWKLLPQKSCNFYKEKKIYHEKMEQSQVDKKDFNKSDKISIFDLSFSRIDVKQCFETDQTLRYLLKDEQKTDEPVQNILEKIQRTIYEDSSITYFEFSQQDEEYESKIFTKEPLAQDISFDFPSK